MGNKKIIIVGSNKMEYRVGDKFRDNRNGYNVEIVNILRTCFDPNQWIYEVIYTPIGCRANISYYDIRSYLSKEEQTLAGMSADKKRGCNKGQDYKDNIKTRNMNIKEKFALALTKEPMKSFRKVGITNGDNLLTDDGMKIFLSWLLDSKYAEEFKKEVVDDMLKDAKEDEK